MSLAEVRLWGRTIGAASLNKGKDTALFEYERSFIQSGIQVAPLTMPLGQTIYQFPELPLRTFHGLPGLLADSLPDRFGTAVLQSWLASQGRTLSSFDAVERLCYVGQRGMGALEYRPASGPKTGTAGPLDMESLVQLAGSVLQQREGIAIPFGENDSDALRQILQIGTSAGGARAKALVAWNPDTQELRSGQGKVPIGFSHWLLKFDGVSGNGDKELSDPKGYGAIEYAYHLMATAAGIHMSESRLYEEGGRRHFMTRRFDRTTDGYKLHMQTLGAMAHLDYNLAGAHSYEQAFDVLRRLESDPEEREELFRRMTFNVLARNQDDHVKNIAFLMNPQGKWRLAPAYDLTFSYQPDGAWTGVHQMSLNGKRDGFTAEDFREVARRAGLKQGTSRRILQQVGQAVLRWPEFAQLAGVPAARVNIILGNFRAQLISR